MYRALLALAASLAFVAPTAAWEGFLDSDRAARACDDPSILARIENRFRHQVRHVPHLPDVEIVGFRKVHQRRYLPLSEKRPIARRYCAATAALSNGKHRTVWYLIEDRMGFASVGDGVEFCVSGFDRWRVYNGHCRVLR
ncbi:MAG: hypothetical protein AB7I79_06445 [Rhizobiaceae bacterium]